MKFKFKKKKIIKKFFETHKYKSLRRWHFCIIKNIFLIFFNFLFLQKFFVKFILSLKFLKFYFLNKYNFIKYNDFFFLKLSTGLFKKNK